MIGGECIVCFAPDMWSDIWRNRHRMLTILARENRVLYVEPRNTLRAVGKKLRKGELRGRDFFGPRVEKARENLFVYHDPLHLPRISKSGLGPWVERRREAKLKKVLERLGFSSPILWIVRPSGVDLVGRFDEKAVMYQVVDDYFSFRREDDDGARQRFEEVEQRMADKADLMIVTSESLLELKRRMHANLHLLRNAVDSSTLEAGSSLDAELPADVAGISRPVLGYIGGITDKLDIELLCSAVERLESAGEGTLLLVGPERVKSGGNVERMERLRRSPRVLFAEKKAPSEVPDYLRAMDVCLIPYTIGPQSHSIDPLKLYEYLAFGKPVVSVDIPSVRPFSDVVRIAEDRSRFLTLLEESAREDPETARDLVARRRQIAAQNTWEARVETLSELLADVLRKKERLGAPSGSASRQA